MPSGLGKPSNTSVCSPTSNCGTPWPQAASSERSSTITTLNRDESCRAQSRSTVVLPTPGGEMIIRVIYAVSRTNMLHAPIGAVGEFPGQTMFKPEKKPMLITLPPSATALPLMPILCPPRMVINPPLISS